MKFKDILAKAMKPKDGAPATLEVRAMEVEGEVEVLVYDQIGYWGITAEEFVREIKQIDAETIHLRIDSPGGDVFMARSMKTALEQHSARVIAHVDGLAASAASYLMLAADEVEIAKGAFVMIHNAWVIMLGDKSDLREEADLLEKIDGSFADDYVKKTGRTKDAMTKLMDDETWFEAEEALEIGLVDRVYEKDETPKTRFDLTVFDNPPSALADAGFEQSVAARRAAQMRKLEHFERVAP